MFHYITEQAALLINLHHAGFDMILQSGWRQAVESWLYNNKAK